MIVNVLRLTLKPDTSPQQRAEVLAALRRTASVESVSYSTVGEEFTDPSGLTIGYVVGIADIDALERYMLDPVHLAGDDIILPRVARVSSVRFADEPVAQKVYALHAQKVEKYPDWGRRLAQIFVG
ncbi:MAG: Stress responsive alpha-beta barrel domain protein [Mycobacterium sp.]|nr:Stress responsive alpha-beta barrel domain protein [Mycobacterium sp.]